MTARAEGAGLVFGGTRMPTLAIWTLPTLALLISHTVLADPVDASSIIPLEPMAQESRLNYKAILATELMQYPTAVPGRSEFSSNYFIRANLELQKETSSAFVFTQVNGAKSATLDYQYISIGELYAGDARKTRGFFLGRKKEIWNTADRDWNLGLWQPLFQEDGLRIDQQGLTGLFYKTEFENFKLTAFASPLFIPTLNADLVEKSGTLVSENRWTRALPERATVNGRDVSLVYKLKTPPYSQLLAKPSLAVNVFRGDLEENWYSVSLGRKPLNALSMKYDAALVSRSVGFEASADVVPVVHMHNIASAEFGTKGNDIYYSAAIIADQPDNQSIENEISDSGFQTDYYQQQPKPLSLVALKAKSVVKIFTRPLQVAIGYLRAQTEKTPDLNSLGVQQSEFIPYRTLYTNALLVAGDFALDSFWNIQAKFLREFDQIGTVISFQANYRAERSWIFFSGFDILGVDQIPSFETDSRFLNAYRHNDRVFGGIAYAF